jgi:hypothetical protein
MYTGLYEINAAFFTGRSAKITLFINDVPVLSREVRHAALSHATETHFHS